MGNKSNLIRTISLIERMNRNMSMSEAEEYVERLGKQIQKYPHSNDCFNLDNIPLEALDKLWLPMSSFNIGLPHRHALRLVGESIDFKGNIEKAKEVITSTYPIDPNFFQIKEGSNGMFAALLMSLYVDNIQVIEESMLKLGFYRANPTDKQLLEDIKGRQYITLRFEPTPANDLTNEVRKYKYVYHTTPSIFEDSIRKNGLRPSNSNAEFRYYEPRVYLMKETISKGDKQNLINTLFHQAKQKGYDNLSPNYTMFIISVNQIPTNVRFYGDINEENGLFITHQISPNAFSAIEHYVAQDDNK